MKKNIFLISLMSVLGLLASQSFASHKDLFEAAEKQINKMSHGDMKLLARSTLEDSMCVKNLDPKSFVETMGIFGIKLIWPVEENNNDVNNNQPEIQFMENNTNQVKKQSNDKSSLYDLPLQKRFELLGFSVIHKSVLEEGLLYGHDPKTVEGQQALIGLRFVLPSMMTEELFQIGKEKYISEWNWRLKKNNEEEAQSGEGDQKQKQIQNQKELEEKKRQQQKNKEGEEKRKYQLKVENFVSESKNAIKTINKKVLHAINGDSNQNFKTLNEGFYGYGESSMSVTRVFKEKNYFPLILKAFSKLGIQKNEGNKEILCSIDKAQGEGNFSTYKHVVYWLSNKDTQKNFPHLMHGLQLIFAQTEDLTGLVYMQGDACINGLNGRILMTLLNILEEKIEKVKKGEHKLL